MHSTTILTLAATIAVLVAAPTANAWGFAGHGVTGLLARKLLDTKAISYIEQLAPDLPEYGWSAASTWADSYGRRRFNWSPVLHYADSDDDPPAFCEYVDEDVCPDGRCVVGALTNYTDQLRTCSDVEDPNVIVKFVIHFMGDLHQPLHVSGKYRGGNSIMIPYGPGSKKLHQLWDTEIVVRRINDFGGADAYVDYLFELMSHGNISLYDNLPKGRNSLGHINAFVEIAKLSNAEVCQHIYNYVDGRNFYDDDFDYLEVVGDLIDRQLARAGFMVAQILADGHDCCTKELSDDRCTSPLNYLDVDQLPFAQRPVEPRPVKAPRKPRKKQPKTKGRRIYTASKERTALLRNIAADISMEDVSSPTFQAPIAESMSVDNDDVMMDDIVPQISHHMSLRKNRSTGKQHRISKSSAVRKHRMHENSKY